MPGKTNNN